MTESEIIDEILRVGRDGTKAAPAGVSDERYDQAFEQAIEDGLINHLTRAHYVLTSEGKRAIKLGGYDKWKAFKEKQNAPQNASVHIGNAIIGNNNTGNTQGSDLRELNNQSSAINVAPQQAQPRENPIKKSDHSIWDKIKYVSVIVGGASALILGLAKVFGWW